MQIIDFYTSLLASLDVVADEKGLLSIRQPDGQTFPCTIDGKRLILPNKEFLRNPNLDDYIPFHPMSESILVGGESAVLKSLRKFVKLRLNSVAGVLISELMRIAVEKDDHKKLTPKQTDLLAHLKDVIPATHAASTKFLEQVTNANDRSLISVYLKPGGTWKGNKYSKVAITSFPPMKDFERDDKTLFGIEIGAKRDKNILKDLFLYIFEDAESPEEYSFGSNDLSAPLFHALMSMFVIAAKRLNKVTKKFSNLLVNPDMLTIDLSWEPILSELHTMRDKIPPLGGNEGSEVDGTAAAKRSQVDQTALYRSVQDDTPTRRVSVRDDRESEAPIDEDLRRINESSVNAVDPVRVNSPFNRTLDAPAPQRHFNDPSTSLRKPIYPQPASRQPMREREEPLHPADRDVRGYGRRHREEPMYDDVVETENGLDWNSIVASNAAVQNTLAVSYYNNPELARQAMAGGSRGGFTRGGGIPSHDSYYNQNNGGGSSFSRGGFGGNQSRGGFQQAPVHGFRRTPTTGFRR